MRIALTSLKTSFPLLLLVFLLIFPKGGFKIADVPLTWGYLLLCLGCIPLFFRKLQVVFRPHLQVLLALLPFQSISIFFFFLLGIENIGFGISFIVHFILFPLIFFFFFSKSLSEIDLNVFLQYLKKGVFLVAVYGIFLFLFVHIFGFFFTIPSLTINWNDIKILETTKCIARGDLFKLISTYNNGNLYGICLLMLLPLYLQLETQSWKKMIVKLSLLLTLSRTVWVGLFIVELFQIFQNLSVQRVMKLFLNILIFSTFIFGLTFFLNQDLSFLFDPTLGGRSSEFLDLESFYWVGQGPFYSISEIVYLSIYKNFGIFGLLSFLFGMTSPIWVYYFFNTARSAHSTLHINRSSQQMTRCASEAKLDRSVSGLNDEDHSREARPRRKIDLAKPQQADCHLFTAPVNNSILVGLYTYLLLSCSDGAILFIPVMAFYWFLSALLITPSISK